MDLRTTYRGFLEGADLSVSARDLAADGGLTTAVILSLFTDRRAADGDTLPSGETDRRGWWGEIAPTLEGYPLGSRLWLLSREKETPETLRRAQYYAEEALAWLLAVGAASSVSVEATAPRRGVLALAITIGRPAAPAETWQFAWDHLSTETA